VSRSPWGWTAYDPNGRALAHSESKALLEAYLRDSVFCTCLRGSEGFTLDPERDLWVHSECGRPSEATYHAKELAQPGSVGYGVPTATGASH